MAKPNKNKSHTNASPEGGNGTGPDVPSLGIGMIAKDEERNLPLSLGPLAKVWDECVVLDTGSRDRTIEVAGSFGAKVVYGKWEDDFALARNTALRHAETDFVLWLDADNGLDPGDFLRLKDKLRDNPANSVLLCEELVVPQGDRLWQKRVFPRLQGFRFEGRIHEQLTHPEGARLIYTDVTIRHWGYRDPAEARRKGERNLALLLKDPKTLAGDSYALYQTGRTLLNLRRHKEALGYLARAAAAPGGNPSLRAHSLILASDILQKSGETDEALSLLAGLAHDRPDYGPGRYFHGRLLYNLGRKAEAAGELGRALALGLSDPGWGSAPGKLGFTCASMLGRALRDQNDPEGAKRAFRSAMALDPSNPEPRVRLAELALGEGDNPSALAMVEEALELAPSHRRAHELFGRLAGLTGDHKNAGGPSAPGALTPEGAGF